jgi:hypothetical protein
LAESICRVRMGRASAPRDDSKLFEAMRAPSQACHRLDASDPIRAKKAGEKKHCSKRLSVKKLGRSQRPPTGCNLTVEFSG